jgi:hypothetical protein
MAPQIYNLPALHRQMLEVLGIKHADKLVPLEEDQKPTDPVSENQNALKGKPLKAFQYQDHEAHIKVHTSAIQDPVIMQLIGQNPQAQAIMGAMQAHIAEHVGYGYRQKIEQALGVSLPNQEDELPEQMEKEISRLMAEAAGQVLNESKAQQAKQQAQQNAQDPVLQLQMQELQLKQGDLQVKQGELQIKQKEAQLKEKKLITDAAAKADEIRIKEAQIESTEKIEGMNAQVKSLESDKMRALKEKEFAVSTGVDMAYKRAALLKKEKPTKE